VLGIFFSNMRFTDIELPASYQWLREYVLSEGWLGMSFFFKMVGFLSACYYFEKLASRSLSAGRFLADQATHVYPIHLLALIPAIPFSIEVFQADKLAWFLQLASHASLVHSWLPLKEYFMSFNVPAWTFSNELLFYVLFPFIVWMLVKMPKLTIALWVALMVGIIITLEVVYVEFNTEMFYLFFFNPWFNLAEFGMGIFAYFLYARVKERPFFRDPENISLLEALSLLLLGIFFLFHNLLPQIYRFSYYYWIPLTFLVFAFAFQTGRVSALFRHRAFVFLGDISLAIYLLHLSVRNYATYFHKATHLLGDVYLRTAAVLLITFVLSVFFHYFIAKPAEAWVRRRAGQEYREVKA
jgi:peptidoglycan/LPS O-acetylase OafA/YrhL